MSLLATLALAASTSAGAVLPQCSWDRPGVNPFMGDVVAAVDHYKDIPAETREKLKARMKARQYEDIAVIERDTITGKQVYDSAIRDMHFGPGSICRTVTRAKWKPSMQERGLVYCEDGECILVPTVCRNVSRVKRQPPRAVAPAQVQTVAASSREIVQEPLVFDPPSAGPTPGSFAEVARVPTLSQPTSTPTPEFRLPPLVSLSTPGLPPRSLMPTGVTPAVPEPGTWAMILAGLFVVGRRVRQARRS
jgi:hypothetical protein